MIKHINLNKLISLIEVIDCLINLGMFENILKINHIYFMVYFEDKIFNTST